MQLLKDRIRKDGKIKAGNVLKVDSFLNHQMDIKLFGEIGKEFKRRFADVEVNKILTIEYMTLSYPRNSLERATKCFLSMISWQTERR